MNEKPHLTILQSPSRRTYDQLDIPRLVECMSGGLASERFYKASGSLPSMKVHS